MISFSDVQQTLDRLLDKAPASNHGPFWRGKTRDEFVALEIYGVRAVVPGEPEQSALLSAVRGIPPFGLASGDQGIDTQWLCLSVNQPSARREDIDAIANWIALGCPDDHQTARRARPTAAAGVRVADDDHVHYWRGVDFFFLPGLSSPETNKHVGHMHIRAYRAWHAFHLTGQDPSVWEDYMADTDVQGSFRYIRHHQTRLIEDAYGTSQDSLFDSLWKFGGNLLPPDPQIAIPSERTMNSPYDWFFWAPYIEMSLRASDASDADLRLARAWQVGIAADGLLRNRLEIADFNASDTDLDQKVKSAFDAAQKDGLIAGMISRAKAFPNSPFFRGWPGVS